MAIIGNIQKIKELFDEQHFKEVFNYFEKAIDKNSSINNRIMNLPVDSFNKIEIDDNIFALEQGFNTKNREECFIESHKDYIDFQLVLYGNEQMEYCDIDKLKIKKDYDFDKDLTIYHLSDDTSKFLLQKNDLAIFFPEDGHIGQSKFKEIEIVYKTVIKFPVKLYNKKGIR